MRVYMQLSRGNRLLPLSNGGRSSSLSCSKSFEFAGKSNLEIPYITFFQGTSKSSIIALFFAASMITDLVNIQTCVLVQIMLVGGPLFDNTTLLHIFNGVSRNLAAERPEGSTNLAPIKNVAVTSFGLVGCHPGLTLGAINCGLLIRRGALMHLRLSNCSTLFFPIFADDESSELENVVDDGWSILSAHCAALESLDLSFSGEPVGKAGESLRANSELASQFAAAVSKLVGASPLLKQLWLRGCPALQTGGGLLDVLDACGANVEVLDLSRLPDLAARTTPGAPLLGPYWPPHNSVVKAALLDTTNPSEGASKWARTLRCLSIRGACLGESNIEGLCQLHALEKLDLAAVDGVGLVSFFGLSGT